MDKKGNRAGTIKLFLSLEERPYELEDHTQLDMSGLDDIEFARGGVITIEKVKNLISSFHIIKEKSCLSSNLPPTRLNKRNFIFVYHK